MNLESLSQMELNLGDNGTPPYCDVHVGSQELQTLVRASFSILTFSPNFHLSLGINCTYWT